MSLSWLEQRTYVTLSFVPADWIVTDSRLSNKPLERTGTNAPVGIADLSAGRSAPSRYTN